jgi:hypothetical protein
MKPEMAQTSEGKRPMEEYEIKFELWRKRYGFLLLVPVIDELYGPWCEKQRRSSEKFERGLLALCRKCGFDPLNPKFIGDDLEDGAQLDAGELGSYTGELLIQVLQANRRDRSELPSTPSRQHGPRRAWYPKQAESILVGLKLLEGSRPGLELLRMFLKSHDTRSDVFVWKDQQLLHLQRVVLSEGKSTVITDFGKCTQEKEQLLARVSRQVDALARQSAESDFTRRAI